MEKIYDYDTGALLIPGNPEECHGNGTTEDVDGFIIECCCGKCDSFQTCFSDEQKRTIAFETIEKNKKLLKAQVEAVLQLPFIPRHLR